jgi:hypothetical protein
MANGEVKSSGRNEELKIETDESRPRAHLRHGRKGRESNWAREVRRIVEVICRQVL